MNAMGDYHDLLVKTDLLLFIGAFEQLKKTFIINFKLDIIL